MHNMTTGILYVSFKNGILSVKCQSEIIRYYNIDYMVIKFIRFLIKKRKLKINFHIKNNT